MTSALKPVALLGLLCLLLSGCAGAVIGVGTAAVAATSTEKGFSTSVSDGLIFTKIQDKFLQTDTSLSAALDVTVNDGAVLLTEEKVLATRLSWEVRGVREVVNEVQVTDKSSLKDIAKDVAAGGQLRAKLIGDSQISSLNFSIDIVNGIVYLSGVARDTEEMNRVVSHARELKFAKQVINYISLLSDQRD
jgi:osmotically-inducible protein OsmY